jgi:hypothetical protein
MKLVREYINEKFVKDSDPIKDLGIGQRHLIEKWIENINNISTMQINIRIYKLTKNLEIDVLTNCSLPGNCGNLPEYINFNIIHGCFQVGYCNFTTMRGFPKIIKEDFSCAGNKLTSLEYSPKIVGLFYSIQNNYKQFTEEEVRKVCKVGKRVIV